TALSGRPRGAAPPTRPPAPLRSYLRHAVAVFGPERCMFGSDWPVASLTTTYDAWLDTVCDAGTDLTAADQDRIMIQTAESVYGLGGPRSDERKNRQWC